MHLTRHAQMRMQQRGKNSEAVKLIGRYGRYSPETKNTLLRCRDARREIERRKRWLRRIDPRRHWVAAMIRRRIKFLEQSAGCAIVTDAEAIVTVYDRTRRVFRRRQARRRRY